MEVILSLYIEGVCLIWICFYSEGGKFLKFTQIRYETAGEDTTGKELVGVEKVGFS